MIVTAICVYVALIFTTAVAAGSEIATLCPDKCSCSERNQPASLTVNCGRRPDIDVDQLTEQLDSLLSSNLTYGRLTSLSIVNSPLTHVPRSVCRLTTLTQLHLDNNQLTRLPDNCFTNLTALTKLTAGFNNVTELQDRLFDELRNLVALNVSHNKISSIGLKVFNGSAMLTSLDHVDVSLNKLPVLEPWPYFVGINGKAGHRAIVKVNDNHIKDFTNAMGLKMKCGMKTMNIEFDLSANRIKHLSDFLRGWNTSLMTILCLVPYIARSTHSTLVTNGNRLHCDCADFEILRWLHTFPAGPQLDRTYCAVPANLYHMRVTTVPLDQLVCELKERCPPGCRCAHRPANATLHVYCSNSNLTTLPLELPALPKSYTKYKLDLSNSILLRRLEHRDYFVNTTIVDASNCEIETINNWEDLFTLKQVYLHGNRLTSLPRSVATLNVSTPKLSLYNNPWRCNCSDKWFSLWLNESADLLLNPSGIQCSYPQRMKDRNLLIAAAEFCVQPAANAPTVGLATFLGVVSFAGALVALMSVGVIVYRLRFRLYKKWKFHPFDRDECLGEDMHYDVFFCCSAEDHEPEGRRIVEMLDDKGFLVSYHYRDFRPGLITANIEESITHSKRTLCLLTANFIRSAWCRFEFETALHHWISNKKTRRLIVLMALDSPNDLYANDASDTAMLRQYLRQYTYIDYTADDWLDKLLYALPLRGMNQQDNNEEQLLRNIQAQQPEAEDINDEDVAMIN